MILKSLRLDLAPRPFLCNPGMTLPNSRICDRSLACFFIAAVCLFRWRSLTLSWFAPAAWQVLCAGVEKQSQCLRCTRSTFLSVLMVLGLMGSSRLALIRGTGSPSMAETTASEHLATLEWL